jgi:hypothetical protein
MASDIAAFVYRLTGAARNDHDDPLPVSALHVQRDFPSRISRELRVV